MAIRKTKGGYGVRVYRGDGKFEWLGTYAKLKDAQQAERDAKDRPRISGSMTVAEWATEWQQSYARPAPATRKTYRYACEQIARDLGGVRLDAVDRPTAKRWANAWSRNTARVARTMFADALRDGLCQHNPFTSLRLETPKGRRDITALTEPEIEQLARTAGNVHGDYGDEASSIILFAAYTGIRPGELAALRWSDLRPVDREATISRALDGQGGEKTPKNGLARVIVLPPRALDALGMLSRPLDPDELVFRTVRGRQLTKGSIAYMWRPIVAAWRQQGGRDLDLYELRHACATLLLERGVTAADVAVQLGHTDGGRLVQTLYGHPDEDRARDRIRMSFSGLGHSQAAPDLGLGQISDNRAS